MIKRAGMATTRKVSWTISIVIIMITGIAEAAHYHKGMSPSYYDNSCPEAAAVVLNIIKTELLPSDDHLPADMVRLHFHDCFVRGCDASALIESTPENLAEKDALPNKNSLGGFDAIERLKSAVEDICPGVVSCADIVALAARDALQLSAGLHYAVPLGRRDGVVSSASEASANLPSHESNFAGLVENFERKGLTAKDMVILSGAHTIGHTRCRQVYPRIYNFSSTVETDPSLNPSFAAKLKGQCPISDPSNDKAVLLDPTRGGQTFDSRYYTNVLAHRTALISDSVLISNPQGKALVKELAANSTSPFFKEFGKAMVKMGQIGVLTGNEGVIRRVCSQVDPTHEDN